MTSFLTASNCFKVAKHVVEEKKNAVNTRTYTVCPSRVSYGIMAGKQEKTDGRNAESRQKLHV